MIFRLVSSYTFVDHFGLATTLLPFMFSPRTSNLRTEVTLDSNRVKSKLMTFPVFNETQSGAVIANETVIHPGG